MQEETYIVSPEERKKITSNDTTQANTLIKIIQETGVCSFDMEYEIFREDGEENLFFNKGFELHGCGFAARSGTQIISHYFRTREAIQLILRSCFNSKTIAVAHNAKADYVALKAADYDFEDPDLRCTMLGYNLLDEERNSGELGLKVLAPRILKKEMISYSDSTDEGLDAPKFIKYANEDSVIALEMYEFLNPYITKLDLSKAWKIVSASAMAYGDVELYGIHWDTDEGERLFYKLSQLRDELEDVIYEQVGVMNLKSQAQLRLRLLNELGMSKKGLELTPSGLVSMGKENMAILAEKYPVAELIVGYNTCNKLMGDYLTKFNSMAHINDDGRVHATFWLDSKTGRARCTKPNIQQVANSLGSKFKLNKKLKQYFDDVKIRGGFSAPKDNTLIIYDFSALEYRIAAAYTKDKRLISIYNHVSCDCGYKSSCPKPLSQCPECNAEHGNGFSHGRDFHIINRDIANSHGANIDRKKAKQVSFHSLYGGSAFTLGNDLGIKRSLAQEILDAVLSKHPGLLKWHADVDKQIKKGSSSQMRDWFGRRRKVNTANKTKQQVTHLRNALINFGPQSSGSTATQLAAQLFRKTCMQKGIWGIGEGKCTTINIIHDELCVQSHDSVKDLAENVLKWSMENATQFGVPLYAEGGQHQNWSQAK
tara:strand:- start:3469 stop:5430 length:1962 start_codon:yes stop_codon:yes gene_type:complete